MNLNHVISKTVESRPPAICSHLIFGTQFLAEQILGVTLDSIQITPQEFLSYYEEQNN